MLHFRAFFRFSPVVICNLTIGIYLEFVIYPLLPPIALNCPQLPFSIHLGNLGILDI